MNVVQSKGRACLLGLLAGVIVLAPGSATAQPGCVEFFPNAQLFGFTVHRPPSRTPANPPTRSSTATSARCQ